MKMASSWLHRPSAILPCSPPFFFSPGRSRPRRPPSRLLGRLRPRGPATRRVEVSGFLFGDANAVVDRHDPDTDGQWEFWLRHGTLTFDFDLGTGHEAYFGISPAPSFERVENFWGYRAVEGGETNKGKKAMPSVAFLPTKQVAGERYAVAEDRPDSTDRTTFHAFAGFKGARSRYGVEYAT
jgi:hypothetical protein